MAGENNNGSIERGHITIDLKNINIETLIDIVNKIDVEKLSAALSMLGIKQDNKTSSNLTNTDDIEKKLKLELGNNSNNETEMDQLEPIEGTEDTNAKEEKKVVSNSNPSNKAVTLKDTKEAGLRQVSNNPKQNILQNQVNGSSDTRRDHAVYKDDNLSKGASINKDSSGSPNNYRYTNDKDKTAITSNPGNTQSTQSKQSTPKNGNPANQLIQALTTAQGKNNKSKSGSGNINIQENPPTKSAANRTVGNASANTMNKKLEILNAIKPMLDYERYQILDNIIKIYSISKFL